MIDIEKTIEAADKEMQRLEGDSEVDLEIPANQSGQSLFPDSARVAA
jgi:hypothetical protein